MNLANNLRILKALLVKELLMMRRNPFIPKIIIIMPIAVMLFLPLVATMDVRNVRITVVDNDHSQLSRRLTADLDAARELTIYAVTDNHSEALATIEKGNSDIILTIPPHWQRDLSQLNLETNGVNATKGMIGTQYLTAAILNSLHGYRIETGITLPDKNLTVSPKYNPTLNFRNFMIPALLVILLIIICGFLPALNLVGEKESGTIEAINVTPVGRLTFVLSKLIPFWTAGLFVITIGMIIGWLVYDLKPEGSIASIYFASLLFIIIMSGIGVVIANTSSIMLQSIMVMFAIIIVFQLMGGLFTPISSMPQWVTDNHIPAASTIFQRNNAVRLSKRCRHIRSQHSVCSACVNCRHHLTSGCLNLQETLLTIFSKRYIIRWIG